MKSTKFLNLFGLSFGGRRSAPVAGGKCGDSVISRAAWRVPGYTAAICGATVQLLKTKGYWNIPKDTERYYMEQCQLRIVWDSHTLRYCQRFDLLGDASPCRWDVGLTHSHVPARARASGWHIRNMYLNAPQERVLAVVQVIPRHRLVCDLAIWDPVHRSLQHTFRFRSLKQFVFLTVFLCVHDEQNSICCKLSQTLAAWGNVFPAALDHGAISGPDNALHR